jgi:hypothetical protein
VFLDPEKSIEAIRQRLAETTNPAIRNNLEVIVKHMETERDRDLDTCMDTISEHPVYYQWGGPEKVQPKSREQVRTSYAAAFAERRGAYLQYDIDRIVADEHAITTDGVRRSVFPGAVIGAPDGWPVSNYPVSSPEQLYLVTERQMTVWPFDSAGLLAGEEFYRVVSEVRPLEPHEAAEVPDH